MSRQQPGADRGSRYDAALNEIKAGDAKESLKDIVEFNLTPKQFKETILDPFIIGQEEGKKRVAKGITYYFKDVALKLKQELFDNNKSFEEVIKDPNFKILKENSVIIGPTGAGKTYTCQVIARAFNIPFLEVDMTKYSGAGYVGKKIEDIPLEMLARAGGDVYRSQLGIVLLDEIDKTAVPVGGWGPQVNTQQVQEGLLKFVEGVDCTLPSHVQPPKDIKGNVVKTLSTKLNYIVASGAFEGTKSMPNLKEITQERMRRLGLNPSEDWSKDLLTEDFIRFGMLPQFMGRFPVHIVYHELTSDELYRVMTESRDSPAKYKLERMDRLWGIKVNITDEAYRLIADRAAQQKTGARGCISALDELLNESEYELPGQQITEPLRIDADYIREKLRWRPTQNG
jgi:ATP-dependent Clp protease ATP-binding subunit ClpX